MFQKEPERDFLCYVAATNFDWVIDDTAQLSVRRGASIFMREVVRRLPEWLERSGFTCEPISTGASIGIYGIRGASRSKLEERLLELLRKGPSGGSSGEPGKYAFDFSAVRYFTFSTALAEVDWSDPEEDFPGLVDQLATQAAVGQMQGLSLSLEGVVPGAVAPLPNDNRHACLWDGVRPATSIMKRRENGERKSYPLSPSVQTRYLGGRRLHGREDEVVDHLKRNFIATETEKRIDRSYVFDLEQLTDFSPEAEPFVRFSNLQGKMAVIHIDGNGFGNVKAGLKSKEAYREFDDRLQEDRRRFLIDLFDRWGEEKAFLNDRLEGVERCRFELLQWGGDEMLFIVPAWLGFPVLQQFFQQEYSWRGKPLTHSAGMVLCPRKTPIARAQRLAEELTDWCKAHSREEDLYATLILESIDYPTQPLERFFELRFGKLAHQLFPLSPLRDREWFELMEDVALLKESLPRSRVYQTLLDLMGRLERPGECDSPEQLRDCLQEGAERLERLLEVEPQMREAFDAWSESCPCREAGWSSAARRSGTHGGRSGEVLEYGQRLWRWIHLLEQWDYLLTAEQLGKEGDR